MITDPYGFVTHEEGDSAVPGGKFSDLINMEPVGTAVKAYVDAFVVAHNANPTDSIVAALIGNPSSLTFDALGAVPYVATSSAARDTHWGTPATAAARRALQDLGALTMRLDLGHLEQYFAGLTDGGANPGGKATPGWYQVTLGPDGSVPYVAPSSAARDTHWGTPATAAARRALQDLGALTIRTDMGWTEQYFAGLTDGGANPGGAAVAGWVPVLGRMPLVKLGKSAAQSTSAAAGTLVAVNWDTEATDVPGWHSLVSNTSRITPAVPGRIRFDAEIVTEHLTAEAFATVRLNGATEIQRRTFPARTGGFAFIALSGECSVNGTTDYIEFLSASTTAASVPINVTYSKVTLSFIGPA